MLHHTKKVLLFATKSILFALFFFFLFILTFTFYIKKRAYDVGDRLYPNVYVDNQAVSLQSKDTVQENLRKKTQRLNKLHLYVAYDGKVATFSADMLHLALDTHTPLEQAYSIGRNTDPTTQAYQQIRSFLNIARFDFYSMVQYDKSSITEYLNTVSDSYDHDAQNALFTVENGKVSAFKIEKNGLKINKDETLSAINNQIIAFSQHPEMNPSIRVLVSSTITKPTITLASSNSFGIVEQIGEGQSNYAGSIPGRIHNVILGTSRFNGVIVPKDAIFSFNDTVGDISAATGYQPAYIIKEGKTVLGDGGGICQVSTTLFRAVMNAGLPVVERHAHAYRVHYYENDKKPGFDATVFGPTVDFKFKNDTSTAILIQTHVDEIKQIVTFEFYGKSDNRKVTISDAKIWDIQPAPEPKYQDDPTLKKGVQKQVDFAAPGTKSTFHYHVERDGAIIQDIDFYSNFRPWQAVFLVGTGD